ncbi:NfeD family protein [Liberiplasma polymorphum]|uniref:NfeD family protein n=1 Tax=Liberiplasma polymorphum TaxID=3374570 RepID=UPI00377497E6
MTLLTTMPLGALLILFWFVIIIVAAFIEINTMDLTSIWFSVGALIAFILSIIGFNILWQFFAFLGVSILLLLSVRPLAKNYFRTNVVNTNADRLIGKQATCTKEIKPGDRGEVKVDGQFWTAITAGDDVVLVNEKVEILAIEGVKLIVVKL